MREEEKITSLKSKWKRIFRKKWVLPSVYIASAALLLTGALWFQSSIGLFGDEKDTEEIENVADNEYTDILTQEAVPVNVAEENFQMPVMDEKSVVIKKQFYDHDASSEEQEAALVFYNNTYYPSTGIDIALENGESFDVVASLSGTVVRAKNDSILGNVVEIEHENGVTTYYQSLDEMHVEAGTQVDQGEVIGTAGTSVYNKDAGIHVHFEIRNNNEPLNPNDFFSKPLSSLEEETENKTPAEQNKEEAPEKDAESEQKETPSEQPEDNEEADDSNNSKEDASISMTRA